MEELWNQVYGFVAMKARQRFALTDGLGGVEVNDLIQSGYFALCSAVKSYTGEYKFTTFLNTALKTAFSEAAGIRWERVAKDPLNTAKSIDVPIGEDEDAGTLADFIKDQADLFEEAEHRIWLEQLHKALDDAIKDLPVQQGETLQRRYWEGQTLKEVAESAGLSVERIRQLEREALRTMRARRHRYKLDQFAEENKRLIDQKTPWYLRVNPERFSRTHSSAVEELVLLRDRITENEYYKEKGNDYSR